MRLSFRRRQATPELITSQLFDQTTFYAMLAKDLLRCRNEIIIESPFITIRRLNALLPQLRQLVRRGARVVVSTKHPDEHEEYLRSEARAAIPLLQDAGVTVLFIGGHHRKLAIIDGEILWEGSLNILSCNDSCEVMRRIESPTLAKEMRDFLNISKLI